MVAVEADHRQTAVRILAAVDVFTGRRAASETVLRGHETHHLELGVAQHIDGVATVRCDRRGVDDEPEPLVPKPEILTSRHPVQPYLDDRLGELAVFVGQGLDHGIRNRRPGLADELVLARRMHPIGEQDDEQLALRIHPDRGAGEPGMTEGEIGEKRAGR